MADWLATIFIIFENAVSILTVFLIQQIFFGVKRCSRWWQYLILLGGTMAYNGILLVIPGNSDMWQTWMMILLPVILGVIFAEKQRWRSGLEGVLAVLLYGWYGLLVQMLESLFGLEQYVWLIGTQRESILSLIMYALLLAGLFGVVWKGLRKGLSLRTGAGEDVIFCIMGILSPVFAQGVTYINENLGGGIYSVVWVIFVLVLNVGIFVGIVYRKMANYYREISENYRRSFDTEYQYFRDYKKNQSDLVRFRHDWRNHMLVLQGLLDQGQYEKAQAYFHTISEKSGIAAGKVLTGNEVADILLNAKEQQMEQNRIALHIHGSLEGLARLEVSDCSILLANLLDNAIEANEKYTGERYIEIQAVEMPGTLIISIENPIAEPVQRKGGQLLTSKADKDRHGIGTQNVREIVERYGGDYQIRVSDQVFAVQILLPLV